MRAVLVLAILGACGFSVPSGTSHDASIDVPPDQPAITWSVDVTSGKAVPATAGEWRDFLRAKNLTVQEPSGLWLMQESSGQLNDTLGTVLLAPFNGGGLLYGQTVAGWTRHAIGTLDGMSHGFANMSDPNLPLMGSSSMTVLALVGFPTTPSALRTFLIEGSSSPLSYGRVDLDSAKRLSLGVNTTTASGTMPMTTAPMAVLMKFDVTNREQKVITRNEVVTLTYQQLGNARGLFLGGANSPAPEARFLYMVAWYGAKAEISDAQAQALLAALDW